MFSEIGNNLMRPLDRKKHMFGKATVFYSSVLDRKKIQNLMREGGKKNI